MARTLLQWELNYTKGTGNVPIDATNGMRVDFSVLGSGQVLDSRKNSPTGLSLKVNNTDVSAHNVTIKAGYGPWGQVGSDLVISVPGSTNQELWPTILAAGGLNRFPRRPDLSFDIDFDAALAGMNINLSYT